MDSRIDAGAPEEAPSPAPRPWKLKANAYEDFHHGPGLFIEADGGINCEAKMPLDLAEEIEFRINAFEGEAPQSKPMEPAPASHLEYAFREGFQYGKEIHGSALSESAAWLESDTFASIPVIEAGSSNCKACGTPGVKTVATTGIYEAKNGGIAKYKSLHTECDGCFRQLDVSDPDAFPNAIREAEANGPKPAPMEVQPPDDSETLDPRYGTPHNFHFLNCPSLDIDGQAFRIPSQVWEVIGQQHHSLMEKGRIIRALRGVQAPAPSGAHWNFCVRTIDASQPCNCVPPYLRAAPPSPETPPLEAK